MGCSLRVAGCRLAVSLAVAHLGQSLCDGAEPWWNLGEESAPRPQPGCQQCLGRSLDPCAPACLVPSAAQLPPGSLGGGAHNRAACGHGLPLDPEHHLEHETHRTRARLNEGISVFRKALTISNWVRRIQHRPSSAPGGPLPLKLGRQTSRQAGRQCCGRSPISTPTPHPHTH